MALIVLLCICKRTTAGASYNHPTPPLGHPPHSPAHIHRKRDTDVQMLNSETTVGDVSRLHLHRCDSIGMMTKLTINNRGPLAYLYSSMHMGHFYPFSENVNIRTGMFQS